MNVSEFNNRLLETTPEDSDMPRSKTTLFVMNQDYDTSDNPSNSHGDRPRLLEKGTVLFATYPPHNKGGEDLFQLYSYASQVGVLDQYWLPVGCVDFLMHLHLDDYRAFRDADEED